MMREYTDCNERCEKIASYIIDSGATVRVAAVRFCVSKSTVHKDITEKLKYVNPAMHHEVARVLALNKSERHLRGGEATRKKYLQRQATKPCERSCEGACEEADTCVGLCSVTSTPL